MAFTISMSMRIVDNPHNFLDQELEEEKEKNLLQFAQQSDTCCQAA